jgi:hypothetical protein
VLEPDRLVFAHLSIWWRDWVASWSADRETELDAKLRPLAPDLVGQGTKGAEAAVTATVPVPTPPPAEPVPAALSGDRPPAGVVAIEPLTTGVPAEVAAGFPTPPNGDSGQR